MQCIPSALLAPDLHRKIGVYREIDFFGVPESVFCTGNLHGPPDLERVTVGIRQNPPKSPGAGCFVDWSGWGLREKSGVPPKSTQTVFSSRKHSFPCPYPVIRADFRCRKLTGEHRKSRSHTKLRFFLCRSGTRSALGMHCTAATQGLGDFQR